MRIAIECYPGSYEGFFASLLPGFAINLWISSNATMNEPSNLPAAMRERAITLAAQLAERIGFQLPVAPFDDCTIFLLDQQGYITSWNVELGLDGPALSLQHYFAYFSVSDDDAIEECRMLLAKVAREGRYEYETSIAREDGSRAGSMVTVSALRDERGALLGFLRNAREFECAPDEIALPRVAKPTKPKRVLVVDDNQDAATTLSALLQHWGHETQQAGDALEALAIARSFSPEVVFSDIALPGIDGYQLVEGLRRLPNCTDIPIVAVSGYTRPSDRRRALRAGFSDYLPKPIDKYRIAKVIEMADRCPTSGDDEFADS
jgi:CheY-like chemotaxis protein